MPEKRQILVFENPYTLSNHLLKKWFTIAKKSIDARRRFCVAFSGGRTPVEFYCKLSGTKDFDLWSQTHVFLADERFVPEDDLDSNMGMIKSNLLNYVYLTEKQIYPIHTNTQEVSISAECYEEDLIKFFQLKIDELPRFDFILLGIGEDGHVASLFPWQKKIEAESHLAIAVSSEKVKHERISLSLPVINNARHIIFIVSGKNKAEILKKILKEKQDFPATKVKAKNGEVLFLLDKEAASQLSYLDSYTNHDQGILVDMNTNS